MIKHDQKTVKYQILCKNSKKNLSCLFKVNGMRINFMKYFKLILSCFYITNY